MIRKILPLLALAVQLATPTFAQNEQLVNAFLDLNRKGSVKEADSPMRIKATAEQTREFIEKYGQKGYVCIAEDRTNSVRMTDAIPASWLQYNPTQGGSFAAAPAEFYTYQIALFAGGKQMDDVQVEFSDLKLVDKSGGVKKISKAEMRSFNMGGVGLDGKPFANKVDLDEGEVRALWIGVQIPQNAKGRYTGEVTIRAKDMAPTIVPITIKVDGEALEDGGTGEGWRMARLKWLDSQVGSGTEPTAPYTPLVIDKNVIKYRGGSVKIGDNGLPSMIQTHYNTEGLLDSTLNVDVLAHQMQFIVLTSQGEQTLMPTGLKITKPNNGRVEWSSLLKGQSVSAQVNGFIEFDGFTDFSVTLKALSDVEIKDIRFEVPYSAHASRYAVGMGRKGGDLSTDVADYVWDTTRHQDAIWIGNVNAGLNLKFKDQNYRRPLVNIYYQLGRLNMPDSWGNAGRGGVSVKPSSPAQKTIAVLNPHAALSHRPVTLTAFSGERAMHKGEELTFGVEMLITPVKPLDMAAHVTDRFYHSNSDLSDKYIPTAKAAGANYINIHHKKEFYPYINYPYYDESVADFKAFSDKARAEGIGTRVYYTTRELTVKVPEIWALRSLGGEVIHDGPGRDTRTLIHRNGPNEWLNENMGTHFIPAWYNAFNEGKYKGEMDISVITTPDSRWNNYYLEGLGWMIRYYDLRGVYIDDSALDRETLKRARRMLDADGVHRTIDIHSWNHFNEWAGYANSLQMYADLLPYVDRTWIGEGFGADNKPDFWLIEMAGLPFGQMSETLDAHNIWRGMIYCMPPRLGWSGNPVPLWRLWDEIGMQNAVMYGYWNPKVAVKTNSEKVLATVYKIGVDKALVAVANWTAEQQNVTLELDIELLGFTPSRVYMPEMEKLQQKVDVDLSQPQAIAGNGGAFILLER